MKGINETLDLFWRVVEAFGIPKYEAERILENIEKKHNMSIINLPKEKSKANQYTLVDITDDDLSFIEYLKKNKMVRKFARYVGIDPGTIHRAYKKKNMSIFTYDKFTKAKKEFYDGKQI